jgi:hypothetical protein
MDPEVAELVVRAYTPMQHRNARTGYCSPFMQKAYAVLATEVCEQLPDGLIHLIGSKCSGTQLGTVTQLHDPKRFRFICAEHNKNWKILKAMDPNTLVLVDDFICDGNTVMDVHKNIPFSRAIVIGGHDEGIKKASKICHVHVLNKDDWYEGLPLRKEGK